MSVVMFETFLNALGQSGGPTTQARQRSTDLAEEVVRELGASPQTTSALAIRIQVPLGKLMETVESLRASGLIRRAEKGGEVTLSLTDDGQVYLHHLEQAHDGPFAR